ncbi:hypothetical protein PHYPSEUDO_002835 [Phytophthora pseudosyringae]|uniref:Uncharacterized protein n=1 Tax=Phytophthora pseudosyringae TaxID=221518 RepID=A0A8T1VS58_9STRA|nr:hypothetical protein PHYPSEUDO_002835 [Phytophthora pseudosyringae]
MAKKLSVERTSARAHQDDAAFQSEPEKQHLAGSLVAIPAALCVKLGTRHSRASVMPTYIWTKLCRHLEVLVCKRPWPMEQYKDTRDGQALPRRILAADSRFDYYGWYYSDAAEVKLPPLPLTTRIGARGSFSCEDTACLCPGFICAQLGFTRGGSRRSAACCFYARRPRTAAILPAAASSCPLTRVGSGAPFPNWKRRGQEPLAPLPLRAFAFLE